MTCIFFFFQAEGGIRDLTVTGVQTCALPICTQSVALFSQLSIDRGEGALLYDVDGNRYVDLLAGVGVASIGYAHPKYVAAMQRQIARVHVGSFTTEHRVALVKLLAQLTPGDLNRSQFYSSGAEAIEAALRLAKSRTGHTEVIGFWGGFHSKNPAGPAQAR